MMENKPGTVDELTRLYKDTIVKNAVSPVGFEVEIEATHSAEIYNPLCGDRIEMQLRVLDGHIEDIAFRGEACAICMASASIMCESHSDCSTEQFQSAAQWFQLALGGEEADESHPALKPLLGVRAYPSRVKCALLPWEAAEKALME